MWLFERFDFERSYVAHNSKKNVISRVLFYPLQDLVAMKKQWRFTNNLNKRKRQVMPNLPPPTKMPCAMNLTVTYDPDLAIMHIQFDMSHTDVDTQATIH
jgi:hypothetical protein